MSYLGLTGNSANEKKSSAHIEGEVGELSESIKRKIDSAILAYEFKDFSKSKKIIESLPDKVKDSSTIKRLLSFMV